MGEADLTNQMKALNDRLLDAYLARLKDERPLRRKRAAHGLANLGR
jgi:hypothetical protein